MSDAHPSKWFLQFRGLVQGPFTSDNLPQALQGLGNDNLDQILVWKRGLSEWVKAQYWQKADQKLAAQSLNASKKTEPSFNMPPTQPSKKTDLFQVSSSPRALNTSEEQTAITKVQDTELFEKTFTQAFSEGVFYRVQLKFVDQPLMSKNELLQLIAKQDDVSDIAIQDPKTQEWKEIYAFPDLVEKFGISRRETIRVPILAQFNGNTNKAKNVSYRVITISEGGLGFTENFDLKIGDDINGQITSPHFFQPLQIKADVVYAGLDGYIGLKFSSVADEAKASIVDYVKKFGKTTAKT